MARAICDNCQKEFYWYAGRGRKLKDVSTPCCHVAAHARKVERSKMAPGPVEFRVGGKDFQAARIALALEDIAGDTTIGEMLDILDYVRWWIIFWGSISRTDENISPAQMRMFE